MSESEGKELSRSAITVLYCGYQYDPPKTGGEWYLHHVVKYLSSQPDINLKFLDSDIVSMFSSAVWNWAVARKFIQIFRRLPVNTVVFEPSSYYSSFYLANWFTRFWRRRPQFLLFCQERPYLSDMNWKGKFIEACRWRLFLHSANRLITNSYFLHDILVKMRIKKEEITVISPVAQRIPVPINARRKSGTWQIICPAHIFPKKGQDILIEAVEQIKEKRVSVVLTGLLKDKNYFKKLMKMIEQRGLSAQVKYLGYLSGQLLAEEYARSDILCFPTLYDTYGIVIQEAMRFGLPIIASDTGGIPEQITNGVEGLLVPPGNPHILAQAIKRIINEEQLRKTLVQNAYKKLETFSTWQEVCERVYRVIQKMG